ncbi:hypothetical protein FXF51_19995 [Nonomuraea sp. PA05]|uniref:hypothetical protein n=1 Tax=Nonomuraea sp. PA05 TaxID=2604466 RepID=UPI0011DB1D11|nr:hypothetical protein [Nonomuraea sp. PA05]TYB64744.1 hypothetical protein FXF51_19995 [Nonomuraea sp. PA05]
MKDGGTTPAYQARYGWDRKTIALVAGCGVFAVAILITDMPLIAKIPGVVLAGAGSLYLAYMAFSRKVAFQVDETGVLLGGSPARYSATTAHVPWEDITGVVLWRQAAGGASVPYVGVTRRQGAPALPGDNPRARAVLRHLVPVPADVAISSRTVTGWRLDKDRLVAAVSHFAPGIPVKEHS